MMEEVGPQPADMEAALNVAVQTYLKDPGSAQFQIGTPRAGYCKQGWLRGNGIAWKGWAVNVLINARNSYGGYTGFTPHTALFVGNQIVKIEEGADFGAYGPSKGLLGGGAGVCQFVKE